MPQVGRSVTCSIKPSGLVAHIFSPPVVVCAGKYGKIYENKHSKGNIQKGAMK